MKIEYIKGDLFDTEIYVIMHGCNAQGVMGSGVARIIRERFEAAYKTYAERYRNSGLHMGVNIPVLAIDSKTGNEKIIVNSITQNYYGTDRRHADYEAIASVMKDINRYCRMHGYEKIALPKIGAGLAGGDWNVISAIIESELKDVQPVVYYMED